MDGRNRNDQCRNHQCYMHNSKHMQPKGTDLLAPNAVNYNGDMLINNSSSVNFQEN